MSDVVIRAEGLGKKYLIGHEAERGGDVTLRDTIMRGVSRMRRSAGDLVGGRPLIVGDEVEEFWALRDVNFEIRRGDVVGIIGRNGAGKSTLLKVLSRITEPTEGRVTIEGRVASLLEVGTGFHPELSGRENIFLNGSILGMTRKEIQSKFDEIVDFAGVEKFIDTPVKRYSSGMKVRLGFSVAAHLDPEILIVDEVLAVGDAEFQKKCLGKMQDVAGDGRTVLFVSHNMPTMLQLCTSGILLLAGEARTYPKIADAIELYLSDPTLKSSWEASAEFIQSEDIQIYSFRNVKNRELELECRIANSANGVILAVSIEGRNGEIIFTTTQKDSTRDAMASSARRKYRIKLPDYLRPGRYTAEVFAYVHNQRFIIPPKKGPAIFIDVPITKHGSDYFALERPGIIKPLIKWNSD